MPKYILYVDVWLLRLGCNFILEYLLLWATASITHTRTRPLRLVLASAVGTLHYLLYLLADLGLIPFYGLLQFLPIIVLVSLAMLLITFHPLPARKLISVTGYFYGIGFIAAGAGLAGAYLFSGGGSPVFPLGTLISIVTVLITAELGWGIVHQRMVNQVYRVPMEIHCGEIAVKIIALVDTGNNLRDPLNNQPVIIVEQDALADLLPPEIGQIVVAVEKGELSALDGLETLESWQTRIRLIPFNSIGRKNGLLVGFRPDAVKVGENPVGNSFQPTIAIHPHGLDPDNEYKALIPPMALIGPLRDVNHNMAKGGETHADQASSDL